MTQVDQKALLPCPWCGSNERLSLQPVGSLTADMPARPFQVVCNHIDHDLICGPVAYGSGSAAMAWNTRALPAPAESEMPEPVEQTWRDLALQFDGHRMSALAELRYVVGRIEEYATVRDILREPLASLKAFLSNPPLPGEQVLAQRIAAEALLRQQPAVAVKPLEWREYVDGACIDLRTHTIVGGYSAWTLNGYNWNLDFNGDRLQSGLSSKGVAKAAAQADYEQRIRSALEPQLLQNPPQLPDGWVMVPKEPTAGMYAAAEREWDGRMSARSRGVWQAMLAARPSQNVEG